jgi:hypothetical protein
LLTTRNQLRIPWTNRLETYFHRAFLPVLWTRNFVIYTRTGGRGR